MQQENRPLYVGIDLGTTNSAAAVFDGHDLNVVRNGQGGVLTPSVVRIDGRGSVLVGSRARRYLDTDPANTRAEFKRLMGTAHQLDFPAHGSRHRPEELAAEVLKSIRSDVADQTGVLVDRAVISVPALFELHQTAATSEAARLAGFERIELIQEPVASAIAAGWTQEGSDGPWLVYDLGGGTFDVSLLDTREGMLRVVAHAGDNFLGGRDFDNVLLDLVLTKLAADGVTVDRANPAHALALRRLRYAAEEAKMELTRAREAPFFLSGLLLDGQQLDVDVLITRAEYEQQIMPLINRSLQICLGLLSANGIVAGGLERLVLVGGPTLTPLLRDTARSVLGADIGSGLDPMTLVAQGAALFAGTVGLDGRAQPAAAAAPVASSAPKIWLQFPTMTSDLTPFVVGKLLEKTGDITAIQIERSADQWQSTAEPVGADGTFVTMVSLLPRQNTTFKVFGMQHDGRQVAMQPATFAIAHGLTLSEPPLARSIGLALADNSVLVYFERGAPLPIQRTFTLHTVETVSPGSAGYALKVPIVQGEFSSAHLCRLVGTLEIPATALQQPLSVGTEVEVLLELDRGGQLQARARIAGVEQLFSEVALLVTPQISLEEIDKALDKLQSRADSLSRNAFLNRASGDAGRLSTALNGLADVRRNIVALRGGDLDAGEQARRGMMEFDAILAELEAAKAWPELAERLEESYAISLSCVAGYGTAAEQAALNNAYQNCKRAFTSRDEGEVERQLGMINRLGTAAYYRSPGAWEHQFDYAASRTGESTDIRRATALVDQGREAMRQRRQAELESVVRQLWELMPADRAEQMLGHGSGLRRR